MAWPRALNRGWRYSITPVLYAAAPAPAKDAVSSQPAQSKKRSFLALL
jgi:hypothetical protein